MEIYRLKDEIIDACKGNKVIMRELEDLFGKTPETTKKILFKNDKDICNFNALSIIKKNLNIPIREILVLYTK